MNVLRQSSHPTLYLSIFIALPPSLPPIALSQSPTRIHYLKHTPHPANTTHTTSPTNSANPTPLTNPSRYPSPNPTHLPTNLNAKPLKSTSSLHLPLTPSSLHSDPNLHFSTTSRLRATPSNPKQGTRESSYYDARSLGPDILSLLSSEATSTWFRPFRERTSCACCRNGGQDVRAHGVLEMGSA